ncbi:MAG: S41 family peptidase, partial [Myxococcota bacterium]
GNIAYVSITSMDDLSPDGEEYSDRAAADQAMAAVMADVGNAAAMIVDIRANEGGFDAVSLAIASWFAGSRRVAWTEQVRNGPGHTDFDPPVSTFVEATRPGGFTGPVVLLTSGGTFSAAETFALAMRVRDNVTIMGEPTSGHLSDLIDGTLPNGWQFSYSGERYIAADGQLYEARGIPVDRLVTFDAAALASGRDIMLEQALAALGQD